MNLLRILSNVRLFYVQRSSITFHKSSQSPVRLNTYQELKMTLYGGVTSGTRIWKLPRHVPSKTGLSVIQDLVYRISFTSMAGMDISMH
jgi:hypothetical protein